MLINIEKAKKIFNKNLPNYKIDSYIEYNDLFIFKAYNTNDKMEEFMDPFFSINRNTGLFSDFSVLTDGNMGVIFSLFEKNSKK